MADSQGNTGTQDVQYNLISIAYHALQGAETYDQYIQDAEQDGNRDLAQFFRDVKEENKRRADRAKQLLGQMLGSQSQSQAGSSSR
jgi:rubrerythrin